MVPDLKRRYPAKLSQGGNDASRRNRQPIAAVPVTPVKDHFFILLATKPLFMPL